MQVDWVLRGSAHNPMTWAKFASLLIKGTENDNATSFMHFYLPCFRANIKYMG